MPSKVQSGDAFESSPIYEASFQNHLVDLVNAWQRGTLLNRPTGVNTHGDDNNCIKIKNETGADLQMGEVAKIGEYLLNEKQPKVRWYSAGAIDTTFSRRLCVAAEPIKQGKLGKAYIRGMCPVRYTGTAPEVDDGLGPKPGQATLAIGCPCFATVDAVIDTTAKLVQATLGPIDHLLCKPTTNLTPGPNSTGFEIWQGTIATGSDSGFSVLPEIELGVEITEDIFFRATRLNSHWIGEPVQCAPSE